MRLLDYPCLRDTIFQCLAGGFVVLVWRIHALRVVDDHDNKRQAGLLQEQTNLGDHQQHQADGRQTHGGQRKAISATGLAAFTEIDGNDNRRYGQHGQQSGPGRPGPAIFQSPGNTYPRPVGQAEPAFHPGWQYAAHRALYPNRQARTNSNSKSTTTAYSRPTCNWPDVAEGDGSGVPVPCHEVS